MVEGTFEGGTTYPLSNAQAALMLVEWLPDLQSPDLQLWLAESLRTVCLSDSRNRMVACSEGIVSAVISVLKQASRIPAKAVGEYRLGSVGDRLCSRMLEDERGLRKLLSFVYNTMALCDVYK